MIIVDISEDKRVIDKLKERVGEDGFKIEQIGCYDCSEKLFPIKEDYCVSKDEVSYFMKSGIKLNKEQCKDCPNSKYIRFADFTNDTHSFYYERKTVSDFVGSRIRRLYNQLDKMDTFISGRKGLILEGMSDYIYFEDSYWKNLDKKRLQNMSPIRQVIELGGKPEWTWSFVRELKMRDMEFVQTWNLTETINFLFQCDEGYDHESKLRIIPKRYPDIPIEQNILVLFDGIGKMRSEKILTNEKIKKDLNKLIKDVENLGYGKKSKENDV